MYVQYSTVCSGVEASEAHVCVYVCVLQTLWSVSGRWIQINFTEVSEVNLEEQIAAWMLFEGALHFSGPAGLLESLLRTDKHPGGKI